MSDRRPPSGLIQPDDTRDRVIALEAHVTNLSKRLDEKTAEMKSSIDQLGADLGGLATKEELRRVVEGIERLERRLDEFTKECRGCGRPGEALERKQPEKKAGDVTLREFVWDAGSTAAKLIAVATIVAILVAGLYSYISRAGVPVGALPSGQPHPTTMASPPTPSQQKP